ncbi:MAG: FAD-dependent oxidoreductase [Desulfobacterales bacterium]|nr:FAD-dependent oxidoreductase [Desulfobacterales bacterium]
MKEKDFYFNKEQGHARAIKIIKEVRFSEDSRDYGYMAENVPCQDGCPAITNIPGYIRCISEERFGRSYELNRMYNIFPGVLGRICSRPCEKRCRHGEADLGEPVNICHLKRSAADLKSSWHRIKENLYAPTGYKIAVVGAGPAGLASAHELATLGHKVTVFEAMEQPGGMLMHGIPEFRLPRDILDLEIKNILRLGVDLELGVEIGKRTSLKSLLKDYDAVITATGCMNAFSANLPGEDLDGVYSGLDFMMRVNNGERPKVGKEVAVIGGGFTAIDCSRMAIRLGASKVSVNLRRTEENMRIDEHEKNEAKFEKIRIYGLVRPVRITGKNGRVKSMTMERTRLIYTPEPPFRKAVPIENSEFTIPVDSVIIAIGQYPETGFIDTKIKLDGHRIWTSSDSYRTSVKKLYAAGDCVTGATDVINAVANGRQAAQEVDEFLIRRKRKKRIVRFEASAPSDRKRSDDFIPQVKLPVLDRNSRFKKITNEVELGYDHESAFKEAKRCYLCNLKFEIDVDRCIYCSACIDVAPRDCIKLIRDVEVKKDGSYGDYEETTNWRNVVAIAIDNKRCIRCGKCVEACPMDCISVTKVELIEQDLEA